MERRLKKGFQIALVEGIVSEVIGANKEPHNVFSKIARAVGHRASGQSKKKDWNAMVRQSTTVRDPIESSRESDFRQSHQSMKRHTTANYNTALVSIDAEKLIKDNPRLSLVTPATRLAYAKFKVAEFRQEVKEINNKTENSTENYDKTSITDDAIQTKVNYGHHSRNEISQTDATKSISIVRPRNKSASPCVGMLALHSSTVNDQLPSKAVSTLTKAKPDKTANSPGNDETPTSHSSVKKDFRTRTPIQEEDNEESTEYSQWKTQKEEGVESNNEIKAKTLRPMQTTEITTPTERSMKQSGRSKLTGEIKTGWM